MALLVFLVTAAALIVLLWVGTVFFQGYIYTEPTREIHWQAPAAGAALALFYTLWFVLIANSSEASPTNIPYDSLFRFSPTVDRYKEDPKELLVERKGSTEPIKYVLKKEGNARPSYRTASGTGWPAAGVEAITVKTKDDTARYQRRPSTGEYEQFVDSEGWTLRVYSEGPVGVPIKFRWGRFLGNLFLNFLHLGLWFAVLWLLLRFQWTHALGFAIVAWLVITLAILPMMLEQAAVQAQRNVSAQAQASAATLVII